MVKQYEAKFEHYMHCSSLYSYLATSIRIQEMYVNYRQQKQNFLKCRINLSFGTDVRYEVRSYFRFEVLHVMNINIAISVGSET